jgi:hypothetical protein
MHESPKNFYLESISMAEYIWCGAFSFTLMLKKWHDRSSIAANDLCLSYAIDFLNIIPPIHFSPEILLKKPFIP